MLCTLERRAYRLGTSVAPHRFENWFLRLLAPGPQFQTHSRVYPPTPVHCLSPRGARGPGASCSETGITSTEQGLMSLGWQGPLMATADPRPREVPSGRGGASPFTLSPWPVLGPAPRLSTASVPFCFPRNRGHGVMQSALFVRELDPEHTRSKEMSYAAIGFAGSPLSRPCSHLWTLQCVSQGLQGKQPGRVPADSPWVWVLQAR